MSDEVKDRFKESIKWLVREKKVNGITGDCGFMMNFQSIARNVTKTPIFISSLCQLPAVTCGYAAKGQIIIMTANGRSLEPMSNLSKDECGVDPEETRYNIFACEDVPYFGQAVANGDKVNVKEATPWIVRKAVHALLKYPKSRALLGLKDNPRFGLQDWQDDCDEEQEEYQYGDTLTQEEKNQLVNKVE
ncbi:PREDICTED: dimethlysulfonioproprionate lyase 7-like [Acropora digitifera]|uniref:dimethlysulfonioproprionate lyase 7-like n=1 Tax=Acropora digitifera TaxID=70779 RepID=UPI00077A0CEE|nr:PREDICTED: dimethlysulfonioproprionate lyase 7-like [Acropora digitifera]